jgi:hypothetical protein
MLNPFFLNGTKAEQGLIQDLTNEHIRMHGVEIYYIPRIFKKENTIIKEVVASEFHNAYPLEAYVEDYEGYGGQGTILSKFGLQDMDDLTLTISVERFETYITPLIKNIPNIKISDRPKEGDLIWFPLGDRLFEIKFVEHEKPFYALQGNYTYELKCELYRYQSSEVVDTGYTQIDDNLQDQGFIQTLKMIGVGRTAQATTTMRNFGIQFIEITNMGHEYSSQPNVAISSAPFGTGYPTFIPGGGNAIGTAVLGNQVPDFCQSREDLFKVYRVDLIDPGYGYQQVPAVSISGGGGKGAKAVAKISTGIVGKINITDSGSGYSRAPRVSFIGISSVGAAATSYINENGEVDAIYIINAGVGYTQTPTIVIDPPTSSISFGSYQFNEVVVGSISSTTARVKRWNIVTNILEIGNLNGEFVDGEYIVGQTSGATYGVRIINTDNLGDPQDPSNQKDTFADNKVIQNEADQILDFSEQNPFGTP